MQSRDNKAMVNRTQAKRNCRASANQTHITKRSHGHDSHKRHSGPTRRLREPLTSAVSIPCARSGPRRHTQERTSHAQRRHPHLLKFASKESHIDEVINGRLHMKAAGCYHNPPGEQGDPLETSLAYGIGIYATWLLPAYCMFTV